MEEEACPIRKQQRRLNPTILDVVKKKVTKLLTAKSSTPCQTANGDKFNTVSAKGRLECNRVRLTWFRMDVTESD
ncbi:hypothetical protein CR513_25605, partial [Mucuna pruriens]